MFKLQRLEITGFKSFADHTELVFTGDGITAVVGPNGCGKSNVADAIAWVLGEQRIKHLRGSEMKDVIFQGSRNRQPSGMAEVVLHMVRDETVEHEPDIEDIDSTLEEQDDQAVTIENLAAEPSAEATDSTELSSSSEPSPITIEESVETVTPSVESAQEITTTASSETAATDAANRPAEAATPKIHPKRHWRPSRMALEFA